MERVKEIFRLFQKHQFKLAGLRSFGEYITDDVVAEKRKLAEALRADPARFAEVKTEAAAKLEKIAPAAKGVSARRRSMRPWVGVAAGIGVAALAASVMRRRRHPHPI
jgi:hypothetical protein